MRISDVCKLTGFTSSTLRYYESRDLIRHIKKDAQGIRYYSDKDLAWIKFLGAMKKSTLSLKELMPYAELYYSKNESFNDRLEVTMQCREKLENKMNQLKQGMDFIDCKINFYKSKIEKGILFDED